MHRMSHHEQHRELGISLTLQNFVQWQEACFLGSLHDMIKNPLLLLGQIRQLLNIPAI